MSIDTSTLLVQLNNTGLQNKDTPLYQFLNQLLGVLKNVGVVASNAATNVTNASTVINNTTTVIGSPIQSFWDDNPNEETFISSPSVININNTIISGSPAQLFWDDTTTEDIIVSFPQSSAPPVITTGFPVQLFWDEYPPEEVFISSIPGNGTAGKLSKWSSSNSLTDSIAQEAAGAIGIGGAPNDTLDVKGLFRITGVAGQPNYARFDNTANAGKLWRFGNTGAGPATSFDIYNQTDNITAISLAAATGLVKIYGNTATVGFGVPAIYATARLTGQTTVPVTLLTFSVPAIDSSYLISGVITITSASVGTVAIRFNWTDEGGTANVITLVNASAVGQASILVQQLRSKASTTITATLVNPLGGSFTMTYNAEVWIMQIG